MSDTASTPAAAADSSSSNNGTPPADSSAELTTLKANFEKEAQRAEKEMQRARKLEAELVDLKKKFEPLKDIDPERFRAQSEEVENLRKEIAESSPEKMKEWRKQQEERLKVQADSERKGFQDKIAEHEKTISNLQAKNKRLLTTDRIIREHGHKITPKGQRFFLQDVEKFIDLDDGETVIKDDAGNVRYSRPGVRMTDSEWVDEYLRENDIFAVSTYNGGGQTSGQKTQTPPPSGPTPLPADWKTMDIRQQAEWMQKHPNEAKRLFGAG